MIGHIGNRGILNRPRLTTGALACRRFPCQDQAYESFFAYGRGHIRVNIPLPLSMEILQGKRFKFKPVLIDKAGTSSALVDLEHIHYSNPIGLLKYIYGISSILNEKEKGYILSRGYSGDAAIKEYIPRNLPLPSLPCELDRGEAALGFLKKVKLVRHVNFQSILLRALLLLIFPQFFLIIRPPTLLCSIY